MNLSYKENSQSSETRDTIYFKCQQYQTDHNSETVNVAKIDVNGKRKYQNRIRVSNFLLRIKLFIFEAFFPEGYPDSVSDDYLAYQTWDTVQAFASSISGSLATKAVLEGVGVGDENATSLAATITWLLRQGAGMVGQILFTWIQGSDLDHNCKRWRLFADILNDSAMCLELSVPLWPPFISQLILCSASVARSLVGVAGGATRTAITQHQAKGGNISDVAAKDGSQETLVNLVALLVNLVVLPIVSESMAFTWIVFISLTILHLFSNFKAVSSLCFQTLNKDRLILVLKSYQESRGTKIEAPKLINKKENVFIGCGVREDDLLRGIASQTCSVKINLGVSFEEILSKQNGNMQLEPTLMSKIRDEMLQNRFSIIPSVNSRQHEYNILLENTYTEMDLLHAYYKSYCMAIHQDIKNDQSCDKYSDDFEKFSRLLLSAGWKINMQLSTKGYTGHIVE